MGPENILYNLQKGIVDSTIATAAGLEEDGSFPRTDPALPNHQSTSMHLDRDCSEKVYRDIFPRIHLTK